MSDPRELDSPPLLLLRWANENDEGFGYCVSWNGKLIPSNNIKESYENYQIRSGLARPAVIADETLADRIEVIVRKELTPYHRSSPNVTDSVVAAIFTELGISRI